MGQAVKDRSEICPLPPGLLKIRLSTNTDNRELVAASLILIVFLSITTFSTVLFMVPSTPFEGPRTLAVIAIDGDANFSDTALLEGWPGDGSPESPYIIDGLDIDLGGAVGHGISIRNTQVNFIISNCNITGAYWWTHKCGICRDGVGIYMENVTNGELVNNTCNSNSCGIYLLNSYTNTVVNNTCSSNTNHPGILLEGDSSSNTVANNICFNNTDFGIVVYGSISNIVVNNTCNSNRNRGGWEGSGIFLCGSQSIVANNTCNSNYRGIFLRFTSRNNVTNNICFNNTDIGIYLDGSDSTTVANNICSNSTNDGIYLVGSDSNTVANNICNNNYFGIYLVGSDSNIVTNNTCSNNNRIGIYLYESYSNKVSYNTCNYNRRIGAYFWDSHLNTTAQNTVAYNTCNNNMVGIYFHNFIFVSKYVYKNTYSGNSAHDIFVELETEATEPEVTEPEVIEPWQARYPSSEFSPVFLLLIVFVGITLLSAAWKIANRAFARKEKKQRIALGNSNKDDIIVPRKNTIGSRLRKIKSFKHADVNESLDLDSSDQ